jgi:gluconolactonase
VKPNPDGSEDPILCPGTTLETLFVDGFYTEGPAVGPDGRIYFCDITPTFLSNMAAGNIWAYNPTDGSTTLIRSPSGMASGIQFDAAGRMVIAGGADFGCRSIIRTDLKTGRSHILAGLYTGKHFNSPNDLVIDRNGRIYFTDPRYFGHEPIEQPVFGVYRIDPDGSVHLLLADVSKPNGIELSPDEKTLYVVEHDIRILDRRLSDVPIRDSGEMRILAYDLDQGVARNQRTLVDYGAEKGADGIAVDSAGNIYAAVQSRQRPGVRVYSARGDLITAIELPAAPSNVALCTHNKQAYLYITAANGLFRVATKVPAKPLPFAPTAVQPAH